MFFQTKDLCFWWFFFQILLITHTHTYKNMCDFKIKKKNLFVQHFQTKELYYFEKEEEKKGTKKHAHTQLK